MAEWIAKTQSELGAVIPAPKLTEKLLSRPPFRFLHDVVTNFIKTNDFPAGYFSETEMDSGKVSSKEDKLAFITKAITVVEAATGRQTTAKPAKILAGAEAENTAEFLQLLATCAALSPDQKAGAVRKVLGGGEEPPAPAPAAQAPPAPAPAPAPEPAREEPPRREEAPAAQPEPAQQPQQPAPLQPAPVERPGTATARKPPPAVRNNEVVEDRSEPPVAVAGVIIDKRGKKDDDEDEAKEKDWMKIVEEQENAQARQQGGNNDDVNAQGYLGKQAMEAKRKQEEEAARAAEAAKATGGDDGLVLNTKRANKDRQSGSMGETEMSKLREQLQMLTKASNPLGKFLEAIHEDMDTMSRELEMWKTEARTQATAAQEAQRQTEESLHTVNSQLASIDGNIDDQLLKINIARATILQNDKTIDTMLRMVVNPDHAKKR